MKKLKLATVFSGIGAVEQALNKQHISYNIKFACDNGERELLYSKEEIIEMYNKSNFKDINKFVESLYDKTGKQNFMKKAYFANYKIKENNWYEDIRFIDGKKYKDEVDLFVGGSPCQSFSVIGKRAGLEDARGTLFFEYARLINEIQPKVFIYENVLGMKNHDGGNTWKRINEIFESLDYKIYSDIELNAVNFNIPQQRKRLFVIGFKNKNVDFICSKGSLTNKTMFDFLEKHVDARHYLGKKGFEFVTNPKYKNRARVNRNIIQTQKANQQFNWNGDFVFEPLEKVKSNKDIMNRAFVGEYKGQKGVIRQLSYRECLRLMGFDDSFNIVVPNVWAYRQAGNSIVVDVLESLIKDILKVEDFND